MSSNENQEERARRVCFECTRAELDLDFGVASPRLAAPPASVFSVRSLTREPPSLVPPAQCRQPFWTLHPRAPSRLRRLRRPDDDDDRRRQPRFELPLS